jgi:hypothetical protein
VQQQTVQPRHHRVELERVVQRAPLHHAPPDAHARSFPNTGARRLGRCRHRAPISGGAPRFVREHPPAAPCLR